MGAIIDPNFPCPAPPCHALPAGNPLPRPLHDWLPEAATEGRRVLLIGDIHGCYMELLDLLEKCGYQPGVDLIVSVGDLVNKGPQSVQVGAGAGSAAAPWAMGARRLRVDACHVSRPAGRAA